MSDQQDLENDIDPRLLETLQHLDHILDKLLMRLESPNSTRSKRAEIAIERLSLASQDLKNRNCESLSVLAERYKEIVELRATLNSESDHGCALMVAEYIDDQLEA